MMSMCKEKANSYPHNTFCICSDGTELGQNPKEHLGKKSGWLYNIKKSLNYNQQIIRILGSI